MIELKIINKSKRIDRFTQANRAAGNNARAEKPNNEKPHASVDQRKNW